MLKRGHYDALVIGGGFFGAILASELARVGRIVVLCEKEEDLLLRASFGNQARVHNGYHYPRSVLTALRSRVNFSRFVKEFEPAIDRDFVKIYAVPRLLSKVTAQQFRTFMGRIGAPIANAPLGLRRLFNPDLVEEVFSCTEYAFDAVKLRALCRARLETADAEYHLCTRVVSVAPDPRGLSVCVAGPGGDQQITAAEVFNCSYSQLNEVLHNSQIATLRLKHELTEMALIEPPCELRNVGVTLMCGPFFSCMPFPPRGLHTLSHVRYTPHASWIDEPGSVCTNAHPWVARNTPATRFPHMVRDASRYLPCLRAGVYRDSIWEIKTVLPQSEADDSRPILYRPNQGGLRGLSCIMGGKIDNIYDMLTVLGLDMESC
jgi:glycine/D-amino acid oxidase-like deaminating enzyme